MLRARYTVDPPFTYTGTHLWDMELRKAAAPDVYIPTVVKAGSAEKFPSVRHGEFEDFARVPDQRDWAGPDRFSKIIEHVRLDHANRRAIFLGDETFEAPDRRVFTAEPSQPLFHVEHSVGGTEDDPLNLWRIVLLTTGPDAELTAAFRAHAEDPYLRVFIEVHLRDVLGRTITRR